MPLPPVAFFSIYEIAVRWGCPPADVAGWAAAGHLHVVAGRAHRGSGASWVKVLSYPLARPRLPPRPVRRSGQRR